MVGDLLQLAGSFFFRFLSSEFFAADYLHRMSVVRPTSLHRTVTIARNVFTNIVYFCGSISPDMRSCAKSRCLLRIRVLSTTGGGASLLLLALLMVVSASSSENQNLRPPPVRHRYNWISAIPRFPSLERQITGRSIRRRAKTHRQMGAQDGRRVAYPPRSAVGVALPYSLSLSRNLRDYKRAARPIVVEFPTVRTSRDGFLPRGNAAGGVTASKAQYPV